MRRNLLFFLLLFVGIILHAQSSISGTVQDSEGNFLPGVNVLVKGTTIGSVTNIDGQFEITNVSSDATLLISFIGYVKEEIPVKGRSVFDVVLTETAFGLDEVVAIGYGVQKKANLTGAVGSIKTDDLKKAQVANVSNALVGRLPGVIAKQSSGEPGKDGSQIYIRGVATFQGNTSPSIIIDGVERSMQDFSQLDPNEIESVNILKDAAAASIFGMRGANGVLVIKTRRGTSGEASWSYSYNYGIQTPTRLPKFTDSYGYATALNEQLELKGKAPGYTAEELELFKQGTDAYPNTDWYDMIMENKQAIQQQHNFSVKGGSNKVRYFASLGYLDQGGFYNPLNFNRYNVRSNIDVDLSKYSTFSIDLSGRMERTDEAATSSNGIFAETLRNPPIMAAEFSNGLLASPLGGHANTYAAIQEGGSRYAENNSFLTRMEFDQKIPWVNGLSLKGVLSYDRNFYNNSSWSTDAQTYSFDGTNYLPDVRSDASLSLVQNNSYSTESQLQMNYHEAFGKHDFTGLAMVLRNQSEFRFSGTKAWGYDNEQLQTVNAAANNISTGGYDQFGRLSYIGRLNYAYDGKYLVEANIRRDGTENFAPDYRWGVFSSFSMGWILSEEVFLKDVKAIDFLKLRGSYGTLGNDQINGDRFAFYNKYNLYVPGAFIGSKMNFGDYVFGDKYVKGFQASMGNAEVTWETSTKMNIAADGRLFDLLDFSLDYFTEKRTDILARRSASVPVHFGATLPMENIGEVANKGFEVSLGINKKLNKFHYFLNGNLTHVKNEIVFMDEAAGTSEFLKREGRPVDAYYGYKAIGIFKTDDEILNAPSHDIAGAGYKAKVGDVRYEDVSGDGKVNSDDRTFLGDGNVPNTIYGINGGFEYKNFDFSFMFQGAAGVQYQLQAQIVWPFYNDGGVPQFWYDDHYSAENPNANYSSLNLSRNNFPIDAPSSLYIYDASYLRLKNLEIGYTLPTSVVSKIKVKGLRIYASAQNLLTMTSVPQVDPENTSNMGQNYPNVKSVNFGVKVDF
ncbi:MAG: SusC/RagA family TonB-linked outer membrane protein [Prolixibacteraceae bacterium]